MQVVMEAYSGTHSHTSTTHDHTPSLSLTHTHSLSLTLTQAAMAAIKAYPGGMQLGGGINPSNAKQYLDAGTTCVYT